MYHCPKSSFQVYHSFLIIFHCSVFVPWHYFLFSSVVQICQSISMCVLPFVAVLQVSVPVFLVNKQLFFSPFFQHAAEVLVVETGSVCILLLSPEEEKAGWGRRRLFWS